MKSQSAMEYLMTYGWAILIIAVVLGVLFQLGVFSGSALTPKAQPGSCLVLRIAGQVSLEGECQGQLPEYVAHFNGVNAEVSISANELETGEVTNGGSNKVTITAWAASNVIATGVQADIVHYGYNSECTSIDNNMEFVMAQTGIGAHTIIDCSNMQEFPDSAGVWRFYAMETDGSNEISYAGYGGTINGGTVEAITHVTLPAASPLSIGASGPFANYFNGSIANVQIYNTSLSSNELAALYQEGIGGAPINIQNLVGWWPLNGNAQDYSGNNNNGQISGGVSFNSSWQSGYTPP